MMTSDRWPDWERAQSAQFRINQLVEQHRAHWNGFCGWVGATHPARSSSAALPGLVRVGRGSGRTAWWVSVPAG